MHRYSFITPILVSTQAILLLSFSPQLRAKTTWENVNLEPGQDNGVMAMTAVDGEHAWAVVARNNGQSTEIVGLRTTNGTSWQQMMLPQGSGYFPVIVTAIIFRDADVGYLAAMEMEGLSEVNKIFTTDNGGQSWTEIARVDGSIREFQLRGGVLYAVGGGYFMRSEDGQSWSSSAVSEPAAGVSPAGLFMLNDSCGWLVGGLPPDDDENRPTGSNGAVWYTTDGGQSWEAIAQGLPYYLRRAWFLAGDIGFAVGHQGIQGVIVRTTDGGATWTPDTVPDHPAMPDVCLMTECMTDPSPVTDMTHVTFWDVQRGIALGLSCTGGCGVGETPTFLTAFLRTYDGGATWEYDEDYEAAMPDIDMQMMTIPGELTGMYHMAFPDPNHGFLGGQHNMILRYDADWIEDEPSPGLPACDSSAAGDGGITTQPDAGAPTSDASPNGPAGALQGCGCSAPGGSLPSSWPLWLAVSLALLLRSRRRRC